VTGPASPKKKIALSFGKKKAPKENQCSSGPWPLVLIFFVPLSFLKESGVALSFCRAKPGKNLLSFNM